MIDDDAPHFDPLAAPALEAISAEQAIRVGGQGIRLLRQFADAVEYEPTREGNRLRLGFAADSSARAK